MKFISEFRTPERLLPDILPGWKQGDGDVPSPTRNSLVHASARQTTLGTEPDLRLNRESMAT